VLERSLEKKLAAKVKTLGGYIAKLDAKANKGVPDRIITINGRTFYLELKTESGVVSPLQAHQHEQIRKAGGEVFVAYGWEQIDALLA
jgi:hypothetical protein